MQRAAFAGIKNLHTASFRNDSPLQVVQSRFPEKYGPPIVDNSALDFTKMALGGGAAVNTEDRRYRR